MLLLSRTRLAQRAESFLLELYTSPCRSDYIILAVTCDIDEVRRIVSEDSVILECCQNLTLGILAFATVIHVLVATREVGRFLPDADAPCLPSTQPFV